MELEKQKLILEIPDFETPADTVDIEEELRMKALEKIIYTGIPYLDLALDGILPNDVVLVGAKTGVGKSELVATIASTNAQMGKRVHFFALEAERYEVERRLKYRLIAKRYYERINDSLCDLKSSNKKMNFSNWWKGKLKPEVDQIADLVKKDISEKYKTLFIFYRKGGDFGLDQLEAQILSIKNKTDLIIIDHLHYIDFDDSNENAAMGRITKKIRDLALYSGIPIILVAHLRKTDKKNRSLVPELEDFHGSKNIINIATKAVLIGPCYDAMEKPTEYATYMRVAKNRLDGSRARYIARCVWDASKNSYDQRFALSATTFDDQTFEKLTEDQKPDWAKN